MTLKDEAILAELARKREARKAKEQRRLEREQAIASPPRADDALAALTNDD